MWLSEKPTPRLSSVLLSSQKSLFPLALVLKVYIKISLYKPPLCFLLVHHEIILYNGARNHGFSQAKGRGGGSLKTSPQTDVVNSVEPCLCSFH